MTTIEKLISAIVFSLVTSAAHAGDNPPPRTTTEEAKLPIFQPRNVGAPKVRVGGGTRAPNQTEHTLYVLAPEEIGFTIREQPVLYWYISQRPSYPIEIAIADKQAVLLKFTVDHLGKPGIQTLDLAKHGVRLQPGVTYKWSIAVVHDPKQRSRDTFASGGIQLLSDPESIKTKLANVADDKQRIVVLAEEGIWYDELDEIERSVQKSSINEVITASMRTRLFERAGLPMLVATDY